jgi:hypothetical protein
MNYGILRISQYMLEESHDYLSEAFYEIGFIPDRIETDFNTANYLYRGKSPAFNIEVKEGNQIPIYTLEVTMTENGNTYKVTR